MHVIGTAGHVDHGKSTLVEALTGINPDRLKEERERQMTIDLGFAWLNLPGGEAVGVIDVPGHRDFIENMLAGVGGIDAALFVVAADEGVMPQTREHLAILDLLQIQSGVVALTKSDLVEAEWLELVKADLVTAMQGTVLAGVPILPVSARTGAGLPELKAALQACLAACPPRPDVGRPRLPVDRVFTIAGFGAVVTGTLSDGSLTVGDEVELMPDGLAARIRGLQTHKTKIEHATAGSRVAANLAGIEVAQLRRGMVVARPGALKPTSLLDVYFRHLADVELPLKHNAEIKFFVGAAEVLATARVLSGDALSPGASGWLQLVLAESVAVAKGDRFILRRPSPGATIGGGVVVDAHPAQRHRRRDAAVIAQLETLARGTPGERLQQALNVLGPASLAEGLRKAGLDGNSAVEAVSEIRVDGSLVELEGETLVISRAAWARVEADVQAALAAYHAAHPLRAGMPREELKSRLSQDSARPLTPKIFNALIARAGELQQLVAVGASVRLPDHQVRFAPAQQALVDKLLAAFRREPYNTPSAKDCTAQLGPGGQGEAMLSALLEQGVLFPVSPEVLFLTETYQAMVERVKNHLRANGKITVAEVRDLFSTSRKYALALMEHLDAQGVTRRMGDERVLKREG
jgi:selenocysteine-specific elongation factor